MGTLALRVRLSQMELIGVCLAVGGIVVAVQDVGTGGTGAATLSGDLVGLCSAALGAGFALCIDRVKKARELPLFAFQTAWITCALPITLLLPLLVGEVNKDAGLFDWLLYARHWPQVLFLALGMGVASNTCMTVAAQEAGALVLGLIWCLCPIGASALGYLLGE